MTLGGVFKRKKAPVSVSAARAKDFRGEWLAIVDDKIVAHDRDIGAVITAARRDYKGKTPRFARIPAGNIAMY